MNVFDIEGNAVETPSVKYQYFAAVVVNLLTIGFGVVEGWTSPALLLLTSKDTPLPSGEMAMDEASWVASFLHVGALVGNIFFGYIANNFGRKLPLLIIAIPMIISWLLIWFGENVYYYYVARILAGFFGGSGYMIVPIFLSEISDDSIRGTLVSTLILMETTGILLAYIIGSCCNYYAIPKFAIALTTIFATGLYFMPESPIFLMKQNKINDAKKSICFYKNMSDSNRNRKELDAEINKIQISLDDNEKDSKDSFKWIDITSGIGRKALLMGITLVAINVFSGVFAMSTYTAEIFNDTGSNLSPNTSAIIVGVIQLFGSCAVTQFVDRCGRKPLLLISTVGTAFGLIVFGSYSMLKSWNLNVEPFNWIPVVSFSWSIFVTSLGLQSITTMVMVEIMPQKMKDVCVSFCMTLLWLFAFLNIKYLPSLIDALGFHYILFIFTGVCLCGTLFIISFVPETKGKSHEEIMISLLKS